MAGATKFVSHYLCNINNIILALFFWQVLNAAMLYWPMPNVLYVEGYALDRFAEGSWALQPVHQNRVCFLCVPFNLQYCMTVCVMSYSQPNNGVKNSVTRCCQIISLTSGIQLCIKLVM